MQKVPRDETFLSGKKQQSAIGIGSVESAYLLQTCQGVNSYNHPDYPAILVFIEYLCALEVTDSLYCKYIAVLITKVYIIMLTVKSFFIKIYFVKILGKK